MTDEIYTVVLYARVSTDDKGQTNETQVRELKEYCKRHNYVIADNGEAIYQDEQTAKNDKRPAFRELKGRISEGDIDYVLARNQDRISREPSDYQAFLNYCKQFRVRVRYSDNDAKPETPEGVLFDSLQAGLAKADNMKRSSGTKKGMATAKLNGIHCGRYIAFCFSDEVPENEGRIQTQGDHRTVIVSVDTVLDFARNGYSIPKAARELGTSPDTLRRNLRAKGIEGQYTEFYEKAHAKGNTSKRDENADENARRRDDE